MLHLSLPADFPSTLTPALLINVGNAIEGCGRSMEVHLEVDGVEAMVFGSLPLPQGSYPTLRKRRRGAESLGSVEVDKFGGLRLALLTSPAPPAAETGAEKRAEGQPEGPDAEFSAAPPSAEPDSETGIPASASERESQRPDEPEPWRPESRREERKKRRLEYNNVRPGPGQPEEAQAQAKHLGRSAAWACKVLELPLPFPSAAPITLRQIRAAYRRKAREVHPDKQPQTEQSEPEKPDLAEKPSGAGFHQVVAAYEALLAHFETVGDKPGGSARARRRKT
ncbi:unnamed protein product [Polarella glacialis]|uniref:J domain-containing protein n=1 Tax=Polarella glacialis TaxID=89957 RepID=A0A813DJX1_POLGL|nr:unnamed protein product [Polarella glacialis]